MGNTELVRIEYSKAMEMLRDQKTRSEIFFYESDSKAYVRVVDRAWMIGQGDTDITKVAFFMRWDNSAKESQPIVEG